ncbi:MAG: hypothetical protein G01um101418_858 [Parcubacteria group bacterium Gr01-1014_18]|nr:MAG: hypothetical protein Greene041636_818 [Parcubacteria group bacterium Greene0416_36]TSC79859.1 MAG: hypothetical protein G01um101418_858 [Parcubacteria group bacterium Gr01-1014_18]TSC98291.1 MAG: hypothetical protein Greene101420_795 [Parcubacteria group bacterium Greene1014_20]TSD06668.1 MAG: hypothetical protein Greene07142_720 [Parcubacteria group bacterium Greene0714_2]
MGAGATASENVSGFAWTENYGWISHNSTDPGTSGSYGVNVGPDGTVTGYAWSEILGWVQYDAPGPYPALPNYSARFNPCSGNLSGWAKVIGLGDNGWISLSNAGGPNDYGVIIDTDRKWKGYAWSEFLGWIHYDPPSFGGVATSLTIPCTETYSVEGFAWSDVAGWISHKINVADSFATSYGVDLNGDGTLSGYAWSDNLGWVQYDPSGPYPPEGPAHSAQVDPCDGKLSGWAKIIALGDDGWVALGSPGGIAFGVTLDLGTGLFHGFAWNNIAGWIEYDPPFGGVSTASVGVLTPVEIPKLIKPVGGKETFKDYPEFRAAPLLPTLDWTDFGSGSCVGGGLTQKSYQVQIATDIGFASIIYDQTVVSSSSSHPLNMPSPLDYAQSYFWRVRVTDNLDQTGAFAVLGQGGESNQFLTPLHAAPIADFATNPTEVNQGKETQFTDTSTAFGGATIAYWKWDFGDGTIVEGADPVQFQNPKHTFASEGPKTIRLTVTDSDGYFSTKILDITVKLPLPEFRKTVPR